MKTRKTERSSDMQTNAGAPPHEAPNRDGLAALAILGVTIAVIALVVFFLL